MIYDRNKFKQEGFERCPIVFPDQQSHTSPTQKKESKKVGGTVWNTQASLSFLSPNQRAFRACGWTKSVFRQLRSSADLLGASEA